MVDRDTERSAEALIAGRAFGDLARLRIDVEVPLLAWSQRDLRASLEAPVVGARLHDDSVGARRHANRLTGTADTKRKPQPQIRKALVVELDIERPYARRASARAVIVG